LSSACPTRTQLRIVASAAATLGILAALIYYQRDLTLSHYDAKGHLVVARRIIDSLRPGWWQIGAVWLPLPHLLNMLPVQNDWLYRTGLSGVAMSVAAFTLTATTLFWLIGRITGSLSAAIAGTLVFVTQPDVLYLQATPMTESLLMALSVWGVALTWRWVDAGAAGSPRAASLALAGACWTRYEAWPITAATIGLAALALLLIRPRQPAQALGAPQPAPHVRFESQPPQQPQSPPLSIGTIARRVAALAAFPFLAVVAFLIFSRVTVGSWLVTDGFFLVDNPAYHHPLRALAQVGWALRQLNGLLTVTIVGLAAIVCLAVAWRRPAARAVLVPFGLAACAALPAYAFLNGHPFRIRYMVVLTVALAAIGGIGVGLLPRRLRVIAAAALALASIVETPPFPATSPMIAEAQWDKAHSRERQRVTACLQAMYDGTPILASMGSLAHFMQETSRAGFALRDYIHEGIGQIWTSSLDGGARLHAGWVLIEEHAEGGDDLSKRRDRSPDFLRGFTRVCDGGGVALYRREPQPSISAKAE
jgi:hypothetical protein